MGDVDGASAVVVCTDEVAALENPSDYADGCIMLRPVPAGGCSGCQPLMKRLISIRVCDADEAAEADCLTADTEDDLDHVHWGRLVRAKDEVSLGLLRPGGRPRCSENPQLSQVTAFEIPKNVGWLSAGQNVRCAVGQLTRSKRDNSAIALDVAVGVRMLGHPDE